MNPVDHPHGGVSTENPNRAKDVVYLTYYHRVTINILVRRRPSRGTPLRVRRRVSLLRGGRVCSVVPRRQRIRCVHGSSYGQGVHRIALVFRCFVVMGLRRRPGNLLICASGHGRKMNKRFPKSSWDQDYLQRAMCSWAEKSRFRGAPEQNACALGGPPRAGKQAAWLLGFPGRAVKVFF